MYMCSTVSSSDDGGGGGGGGSSGCGGKCSSVPPSVLFFCSFVLSSCSIGSKPLYILPISSGNFHRKIIIYI